MCVLLHLLICTALSAHIIAVGAPRKKKNKIKKKKNKNREKEDARALSRENIYNAPRTMSPSFRGVYRHQIYLFHGIAVC